jgi:hypothetical protein
MTNEQLAILLSELAESLRREIAYLEEHLGDAEALARATRTVYISPPRPKLSFADYVHGNIPPHDPEEYKEVADGDYLILGGLDELYVRLRSYIEALGVAVNDGA